ncbi:MAG TPA: hypothetical protein VGS96_13120, partial [Thermoanaerobaculia bacterium]|nr:hypothetical protein [Thermoanaerobaculia bacterium]
MDAEAIVGEAALRATMAQIVMNAFPGVHDVDITKIAQGKKSFRWRVLIFVTEKFHDDFSSAKSTKILEALYD